MYAVKKRVAKKILKYKDRLHYTPKQIRTAEHTLARRKLPAAQNGEVQQAQGE